MFFDPRQNLVIRTLVWPESLLPAPHGQKQDSRLEFGVRNITMEIGETVDVEIKVADI